MAEERRREEARRDGARPLLITAFSTHLVVQPMHASRTHCAREALLGAPATATLARDVRWLALALDPCVPFTVEVRDA
ncbi:MAG: hypothetical protein JST00_35220 [Deltaproteobacteria bacterium]|nr:hypothetical protein [Deltaproteobacteria bacterium]